MVGHRLDAWDEKGEDEGDDDDVDVEEEVPCRSRRPSSGRNAYVLGDDQVVDPCEDPYDAF